MRSETICMSAAIQAAKTTTTTTTPIAARYLISNCGERGNVGNMIMTSPPETQVTNPGESESESNQKKTADEIGSTTTQNNNNNNNLNGDNVEKESGNNENIDQVRIKFF